MKERPILMSPPMVRATLAGTKTQTRRVVKKQPKMSVNGFGMRMYSEPGSAVIRNEGAFIEDRCPYGVPGDRLWVRETWAEVGTLDPGLLVYRADYPACVPASVENIPDERDFRWSPCIYMPRRHSRITLEVTDVRVERLQDISREDEIAEGTPAGMFYDALWDSINGPGSWDANPWVWVISFKRLDQHVAV